MVILNELIQKRLPRVDSAVHARCQSGPVASGNPFDIMSVINMAFVRLQLEEEGGMPANVKCLVKQFQLNNNQS